MINHRFQVKFMMMMPIMISITKVTIILLLPFPTQHVQLRKSSEFLFRPFLFTSCFVSSQIYKIRNHTRGFVIPYFIYIFIYFIYFWMNVIIGINSYGGCDGYFYSSLPYFFEQVSFYFDILGLNQKILLA